MEEELLKTHFIQLENNNYKIAIIGLGYVGLPLAIEFSKKYKTYGYDTDRSRVLELNKGIDKTKEVVNKVILNQLKNKLKIVDNLNLIKSCNIYIITVPTPINKSKTPDLSFLKKASKNIGGILKKGDLVIYESTVYPGCTEEVCVPLLEKNSGLIYNNDFFCGYSPERINPGDKINTLTKIKKVTSGSTPETATLVDKIYNSIIKAGTYLASSIKVAEASKAIENAQRDLNISFVNELALIFDKMNINTDEVLKAASTKWNFLNFKPGLVGGHCISVDPYYLVHKAKKLGYKPDVILSGRKVNDKMSKFIADKIIYLMNKKGIKVKGSDILILGITFKENCPDIRNSKVPEIYYNLKNKGAIIKIYDHLVIPKELEDEYGITLYKKLEKRFDAIILAVPHHEFLELDFKKLKKNQDSIIYDVKSVLEDNLVDGKL